MADCTPQSLATASQCFCGGPAVVNQIVTFLLSQIAGLPANPQALLTAANAFQALQGGTVIQVQTYTLCQIALLNSADKFILLEDGTNLLLEDGTNFLLE